MGDACQREAAWLQTTGDSLPSLLAADGGRWDVIQAFWPGAKTPRDKRGIYVTFGRIVDQRVSSMRVRDQYQFRLKLVWALKTAGTSAAETEQANFALALSDLTGRVRGPFGDKTHGGRFLSVGEVPHGAGWPVIVPEDPERTLPQRYVAAAFTYTADDLEIEG